MLFELIIVAVVFAVCMALSSLIGGILIMKYMMRKETIKRYSEMMVEVTNELQKELEELF